MNASHGVPVKASTNGRSKKFAVTIARSQRAKSGWRSDDPSIVINVRGLGDKDGLTFSKTIRNSTSFQDSFISNKEELRTQATSTSVGTIGNSVRARSRVFLSRKEVIQLSLINSPSDVIRSLLNISQNIFVLVMPRVFLARLENGSPMITKSSSRFILIFQGMALQHRFLVTPSTLSTCSSG